MYQIGHHVSRYSHHHGRPAHIPKANPLCTCRRSSIPMPCSRHLFLFPKRYAPHIDPGSSLRNRWLHLLLPLHAIHGRMVRQAQGLCLYVFANLISLQHSANFIVDGVMWSGTGLGGFTIPLLLEFFLNKYGFRTTLRIWALAMFVLSAPLVWFIKPRLPFSATAHYRPFNLKFLANRSFGMYQLTNIVQGVGYFLPGIYLPTYARVYLDAGDFPSALTLLVLNVGSVIGCVAMGTLIDRLHVTTCLGIATVGTAIGTFFLWGLGSTMASLYVFCFVYGMFAGCYTSSWPGIMSHLMSIGSGSREENSGSRSTYDPLMVVGWLSAGRGIGNVVSGPLSEALLKGMPWQGQAAGGYGSGYGTLIAFTGATAVVGGSTFLFRRIGWL